MTGRDVAPFRIATPQPAADAAARATCSRRRRAPPTRGRKVVYRFIARHPVAAVDRGGRLTLNSANAFASTTRQLRMLDFVAAGLNSSPVRFAPSRALGDAAGAALAPRAAAAAAGRPRAERRAIAQPALAGDERADERWSMDLVRLDDDERALAEQAWPRS